MIDFNKKYKELNEKQREAVDYIEGPLLVVAGPGSGKTELLGMRVANILKKTDTPPSSILCLTFTNAATYNMRERLINFIGDDAYKIPIYTFHSFCLDIIETYPENFFGGIDFSFADNADNIEIIKEMIDELESDNPLKKYHPDSGYVYLKDIEKNISQLEKGGVTPDDFLETLKRNKKDLKEISSHILPVLEKRVNKETPLLLEKITSEIKEKKIGESSHFSSISSVIIRSLEDACLKNEVSLWKSSFTKKENGEIFLKESLNLEKMFALADFYKKYREKMYNKRIFTFEDAIIEVIDVLEKNNSLREDIQEKYLYIQVDEFQDTSGGQMRLLELLTRGDVDSMPNICVVGDDDQAIYQFQGAEVSNILDFQKKYKKIKVVTLLKNYRSGQKILDLAKDVVLKIEERLEGKIEGVKKNLIAEKKDVNENIISKMFETKEEEFSFVAKEVEEKIKKGVNPKDIVVIARKNSQIKEIIPYFNNLNIPVFSERKENILEKKHIIQIVNIIRFALYLFKQEDYSAESLLPEVISYDFWEVKKEKIWEIAKESHRKKISWVDFLLQDKELNKLGQFFLELSRIVTFSSAEKVLDVVIGNKEIVLNDGKKYQSSFKDFYFNEIERKENAIEYLDLLSSLKLLFSTIKKKQKKQQITGEDIVRLFDFYKENNLLILNKNRLVLEEEAVSILTAHGVKGREFEVVFILHCSQDFWVKLKKGGKLSLPLNIPLNIIEEKKDDALRLFYVAITRAKKCLYLTAHEIKEGERRLTRLEYLNKIEPERAKEKININVIEKSFSDFNFLPTCKDEKSVFYPLVKDYKISSTGLNNFLNVSRGGPKSFFEKNILRFPQKKNEPTSYGTAVHETIKRTYLTIKRGEKTPTEKEFLFVFEEMVKKERMPEKNTKEMIKNGKKELSFFYKNKIKDFFVEHLIERDFNKEECVVDGIKITGKIDKMIVEGNNITVCDYKTGKPFDDWEKGSKEEKIKAWQYKNQLIFYKILVESSRDFYQHNVSSGLLEFVKKNKRNELKDIFLEFKEEDVERLRTLIKIVGEKIKKLDFPDTSKYKKGTKKEILDFEEDLLKNNI